MKKRLKNLFDKHDLDPEALKLIAFGLTLMSTALYGLWLYNGREIVSANYGTRIADGAEVLKIVYKNGDCKYLYKETTK